VEDLIEFSGYFATQILPAFCPLGLSAAHLGHPSKEQFRRAEVVLDIKVESSLVVIVERRASLIEIIGAKLLAFVAV
jgi:hypothetical protein